MRRLHTTGSGQRVAAFGRALAVRVALVSSLLGASAVTWLFASADAGAAVSSSAYGVSRLCGEPLPGYADCLGLRLVARQTVATEANQTVAGRGAQRSNRPSPSPAPQTTEAQPAVKKKEYKEPWLGSLSPGDLLGAYDLTGLPAPAAKQTLALVDAYDDPTIEHDLEVFDGQYTLPACTTVNGCFEKVEMSKGSPPPEEPGWALEISTDVELAHGMCPECKILLVEAHSNSNEDLEAAELKAEELGATEISNSWGGPELGITMEVDEHGPFAHPGTVITASAGDEGYLDWDAEEEESGYADYPASSPHVVSVGGTRLGLTAGGAWQEETVWNGDGAGGGGCSTVLSAPIWQRSLPDWKAVGCGSNRGVADISADADPYTGVSVYDSTPILEEGIEYRGWAMIGGTSVASPIIASTYALAGGSGSELGGGAVAYPARTLYENLAFDPSALHDVTVGSNGACAKGFDKLTGLSTCTIAEEGESCTQHAICVSRSGYDGPSGVGTPDGIAAFKPLGAAERKQAEEEEAKARGEEERREQEEEAAKLPREAKPTEGPGQTVEQASAQATAQAGPPTTTAGGASASPHTPATPVLSGLALTRKARTALAGDRPYTAEIGCTFTLNRATHLRVTLARFANAKGDKRWRELHYTLTVAAKQGRDTIKLNGHEGLSPGRYRLVLTPQQGTAETLIFRVS